MKLIKYLFSLLIGAFGVFLFFNKKKQIIIVNTDKVDKKINDSSVKIDGLQNKIDNLKVEEKTLDEELNYFSNELKK